MISDEEATYLYLRLSEAEALINKLLLVEQEQQREIHVKHARGLTVTLGDILAAAKKISPKQNASGVVSRGA